MDAQDERDLVFWDLDSGLRRNDGERLTLEDLMPKISAAALREVKDAFRIYEEAVERSALKRTTKGTYLQHPERFIRWLEGKYTPPSEGSRR